MACCAIGCKNRFQYRGELHFYRIPKPKTPFDEDRREKWIQAIRRTDWSEKTISNSRICSQHFVTGTFSLDPNHPDFVPSVFSFTKPRDLQKGLKKLDRFNRRVKLIESKGEAYVPDTPSYTQEQMTLFAQNTDFNWPSLHTKKTAPENMSYVTKVVEEIHGLKKGDIISFEFEPSRPPPVTQDEESDNDLPEVCLPEGHSHKDHTYVSPSEHRPMVVKTNHVQTSENPPSASSAADEKTEKTQKEKKSAPKKKQNQVTQIPPNSSETGKYEKKITPKDEKPKCEPPPVTPDQQTENLSAVHLEAVSKDHIYASLLQRTSKTWTPCYICDKRFLHLTQLRNHLQVHLGEKNHICPICDKRFSSPNSLVRHIPMHNIEKAFSCSVCNKKFKYKRSLDLHSTRHSRKQIECKNCGKKFNDRQSFRNHMRYLHEDKPYRCPVCRKCFETLEIADKHLQIHVREQELRAVSGETSSKDLSNVITELVESKPSEFLCSECGQEFVKKVHLTNHVKIHIGGNSFKCLCCALSYSNKAQLLCHMLKHDLRTYKCQVCSKGFKSYCNLKVHSLSHTRDKTFLCEICGLRFSVQNRLDLHQRTHTGEKPYQCPLCPKRFISNKRLKKHTPHANQTYSCSDCKRKFKYIDSLKKHMKRHEEPRENQT